MIRKIPNRYVLSTNYAPGLSINYHTDSFYQDFEGGIIILVFADMETEAQRNESICSRLHRSGLEPR